VSYRDRQAALSSSDPPKPGILVLIYQAACRSTASQKNIFPFAAFSSTIIRFVEAAG
jgi:sorbitol-specific phosphotransferase system component IIBC